MKKIRFDPIKRHLYQNGKAESMPVVAGRLVFNITFESFEKSDGGAKRNICERSFKIFTNSLEHFWFRRKCPTWKNVGISINVAFLLRKGGLVIFSVSKTFGKFALKDLG